MHSEKYFYSALQKNSCTYTLHGVYPLQRPSQRPILNLAWASVADWSREVVHETTDEVYTHRGATHVEDDRS